MIRLLPSFLSVLSLLIAMALTACAAAPPVVVGPTIAQSELADAVVIDAEPLPFDPTPLPPNTVPGDCLVRSAGGWSRVPCGPTDDGRSRSERYAYGYQTAAPYTPPYYGAPSAGRDAEGYLVWPGKSPRR
jgi:hypothetical protein